MLLNGRCVVGARGLESFRGLSDRDERAREQVEDFEVLRIRLEAELELRQRLEAVLVAASALEVELRRYPRIARLGAEMQDSLDDLQRVVTATKPDQQLRGLGSHRALVNDLRFVRLLPPGLEPAAEVGLGFM